MISRENQELYKELNSAEHGKVAGEYELFLLRFISLKENYLK